MRLFTSQASDQAETSLWRASCVAAERAIGASSRSRALGFVPFVFIRPAAGRFPNDSQAISKRSQATPHVPKCPQTFPNGSQMVPNPFFNQFSVKHTPFFRRISKSLVVFFRGAECGPLSKLHQRSHPSPQGAQPPEKHMAERRNPISILGSPWVRPGSILGSSWVRPGFVLGSSWVRPVCKSRRKTAENRPNSRYSTSEEKNLVQNNTICTTTTIPTRSRVGL